jgi:hypothetical protein
MANATRGSDLDLSVTDRLRHALKRSIYPGNLPEFVILGAQKAGTRFLQEHLESHPNIRIGSRVANQGGTWKLRNEIHYFDRHYDLGRRWYRSHFLKSPLEVLRNETILFGEKTADYLCGSDAPARLREVIPETKLIVLLRNPVDRAYSQFRMIRRKGRESRDFGEVVHAELEQLRAGVVDWDACVARGIYAPQLERWFEHFPRERFLIIQSERMYERPRDAYQEVLSFLQLPDWDPGVFVNSKKREFSPMPADVQATLSAFYRPHDEALYDLLGTEDRWD